MRRYFRRRKVDRCNIRKSHLSNIRTIMPCCHYNVNKQVKARMRENHPSLRSPLQPTSPPHPTPKTTTPTTTHPPFPHAATSPTLIDHCNTTTLIHAHTAPRKKARKSEKRDTRSTARDAHAQRTVIGCELGSLCGKSGLSHRYTYLPLFGESCGEWVGGLFPVGCCIEGVEMG